MKTKLASLIALFAACYNVFAQPLKLVLPVGHPQGILQVASTPDGKYIISRSFNDKNARIWSSISGNLVSEIFAPQRISYFVPAKNNSHIFLVSDSAGFYWNLFANKAEVTIKDAIKGATFFKKGNKILYYTNDTVKIVNIKDCRKNLKMFVSDTVIDVRALNDSDILVICKKSNKILFKYFNSITNKLFNEFNIKNIKVSECRFDEDSAVYRIFANSGDKIYIYSISKINYQVIDTQTYKSFGFSDGINDYSPETGCYLIGYAKNNKIIIMYPNKHLYFEEDEKQFTTALTHVKFINRGRNAVVQLYNNSNLDIYDDSMNYLQSFYSLDTSNYRNVFASIFYNKGTNGFMAVLEDNIIREFKSTGDTCKLVNSFSGRTSQVNVVFSLADTLHIGDGNGFVKGVNLKLGSVLNSTRRSADMITTLKYNRLNGYCVLVSYASEVLVWNKLNNRLVWNATLKRIPNISEYFNYPYCDVSDNYVLTRVGGFKFSNRSKNWYRTELRDIRTGKILKSKKLLDKQCGFSKFNIDGDEIIDAVSTDSTVYFTDVNFRQIRKFTNMGWVVSAQQSKSKRYLVTMDSKGCALYDYRTGALNVRFDYDNDNDYGYGLSDDDSFLIINSSEGTISVCDVFSQKVISKYRIHTGSIVNIHFIENKKFVTYSEDGYLKYWQLVNGVLKEIFAMVPFDRQDYATMLPNGNYRCTPAAAKLLHYVTSDLKVITFEQLDVKYNRPDKVLEAIGNTDTALINSYRKAYEKRIKKLGVDTTSFQEGYSVPEADFINRNNIEYEQKSNVLAIHIKGEDSAYKLDRFNIWVNEIPLYGQKGISLRKQNRNSIDTTLTIQLSNGENRIETSILNVNGTESYRIPLSVKYLPEKASAPKVHFIGLAVEKFNNPGYNLDYSVKDIRDMARRFKQRYGDTLEIDTLMNEGVTYTSVAALKQKLLKTNVNDKVILAYSGHGLLSKEYDYYLGTSNVDFEHPEINGLPYDALENLLDSIPARQKLMLIDACHSGEVDKEEGIHIAQFADSLGLRRGAEVSNSTDTAAPHLGLNNSFELMQNLFVNVGKGTGATIISASAGNQFALERGDLENGVFTFSILEAMNNNPTMLVSQLKSTVGKRVVELTGGMQKPTSRNEIINSDWRLW